LKPAGKCMHIVTLIKKNRIGVEKYNIPQEELKCLFSEVPEDRT
jgi:hypothetical protein